MRIVLLGWLVGLTVMTGTAQPIRLRGIITDQRTGEALAGANGQLVGENTPSVGFTANRYGFYATLTKPGPCTLIVSYVGYQTQRHSLRLQRDTLLNIALSPALNQLAEVTVQAPSPSPTLGYYALPLSLVQHAPALLGEPDALKLIQTLPGVQGGTEGTAGLHVRGGSPDQNLLLLDGMPVYNAFHLFGFFSVFNPDALQSVDFYKSHVPARYGGRLSSVIDMTMKEGNADQAHYSVGLSPIAGNLLAQGPLKKGVASYLISARRTWLDLISRAFFNLAGQTAVGYHFDDINAKINYKFSPRRHLYASLYRGRDRFNSRFKDGTDLSRFSFNWGNYTATLRYTQAFSPQLFGAIQVGYSQYKYALDNEYRSPRVDYFSRTASQIADLTAKADFDWTPLAGHQLRLGGVLTRHQFIPTIQQSRGVASSPEPEATSRLHALEMGVYLEDDWTINSRLKAQMGVHLAAYRVQQRWYVNPQPRMNLRYALTPRHTLQVAYNDLAQYLHLLTNAGLGLPTDLWVSATAAIPPQRAQQLSLSYSHAFPGNQYRMTLEAYGKTMHQVLDYREGASLLTDPTRPWYDRVVTGQGRSYGLEAYGEKTAGPWTGWLSYTLAKTERQFSALNQGRWFPYKYDRRHTLNAVARYSLTPRHQLTGHFVVNTGHVATVATSTYQGISPPSFLEDATPYDFYTYAQTLGDLSQRNNFRLPAYHRFDLSYKTTKVKKRGTRSWVFSCYNVYNRKNPFFVYYQQGQLTQFTLFTIIPALAYHYDF